MKFCKMHACGNDFIITEDCKINWDENKILKIANRNKGIGFNQLLIAENFDRQKNLVNFKIYNSDGSLAKTCINGTMCLAALFADRYKLKNIDLCSFKEVLKCQKTKDAKIAIELPQHSFDSKKIGLKKGVNYKEVKIQDVEELGIAIELGNPHLIFFINSPEKFIKIEGIAKKVQSSGLFKNGINTTLCLVKKNRMQIKTWERGAGKTLSCGSASICTYIVAKEKNYCGQDTLVESEGGTINFFCKNDLAYAKSSANFVFSGFCNSF